MIPNISPTLTPSSGAFGGTAVNGDNILNVGGGGLSRAIETLLRKNPIAFVVLAVALIAGVVMLFSGKPRKRKRKKRGS